MKYVYLVRERMFMTKGEDKSYCGVRYYSSLKKAKEDFDKRVEWYGTGTVVEHIEEGEVLLTINKTIQLQSGAYIEFDLQKHEVE